MHEGAARLLEDEDMFKRRRFSLQIRFNVKTQSAVSVKKCSEGEIHTLRMRRNVKISSAVT